MGFTVVAQSPGDFHNWLENQLKPSPSPTSGQIIEGERDFVVHCGICHTVRGTQAGGHVGPDLTHLMSRGSIAADTLPNNVAYLSGWIANPQAMKPGNLMPTLTLSPPVLTAIRAYLLTLH
jgi:cytochrome c oxidase subunit 2